MRTFSSGDEVGEIKLTCHLLDFSRFLIHPDPTWQVTKLQCHAQRVTLVSSTRASWSLRCSAPAWGTRWHQLGDHGMIHFMRWWGSLNPPWTFIVSRSHLEKSLFPPVGFVIKMGYRYIPWFSPKKKDRAFVHWRPDLSEKKGISHCFRLITTIKWWSSIRRSYAEIPPIFCRISEGFPY